MFWFHTLVNQCEKVPPVTEEYCAIRNSGLHGYKNKLFTERAVVGEQKLASETLQLAKLQGKVD